MLWKERRQLYGNLVRLPTSARKVIFTLYRRQVCLKGGAMLLLIIVLCIRGEKEVQGTINKIRPRHTFPNAFILSSTQIYPTLEFR
jgi:hypothetical protein